MIHVWPLVIGGGAAYAAYQSLLADPTVPRVSLEEHGGGNGWMWPVPIWRGRKPVISDGFNGDGEDSDHRVHKGVDIMFRRSRQTEFPEWNTTNHMGSAWHFIPGTGLVCVAARDGLVWTAAKSPRGWNVVLDHGKPYATYYQHMSSLLVRESAHGSSKERVVAGQPIGFIGGSPIGYGLFHLHFEWWVGGGADHAQNPAPMLTNCNRWVEVR